MLFAQGGRVEVAQGNMLVADISRAQLSLVPCLRGDRRVKNHRIALLALQQYNQCLLVCLSPAAVCMILFLIITGRKPHLKPNETSYSSQLSGCTHSQWSKHTRRKRKLTLRWVIRYKSGCKDESGLINVRHASGRGSVCLLGLRYEMDTKYQSRRVMKVLLLKAGDVESNPGPKRALDMKNLTNDLSTVAMKWFDIGIQLKIEHSTLKNIESDHRSQTRCLSEMLRCWFNNDVDLKWDMILDALESPSVNEKKLAGKIRQELLQCERSSDDTPGTGNLGDKLESVAGAVATELTTEEQPPYVVITEHKKQPPYLEEPELSGIVHKLKGLSVDVRSELQSWLYFESIEMEKKFNRLFVSVRQSLDRRQIPPKDVIEILMGFGSFKPVSKNTNRSAFEEDFANLQAAKTVQSIMQLVRSYCNFFSYDIIEELVNQLGDEDDKKHLTQYEEDFTSYARRKVYESPFGLSPITESGQAIVCVTLDESYDDCTLSHLRLLQSKLCHILRIKGVLRLCSVHPGSIKVFFSMPKLLERELFPLSFEQKIALFAHTSVAKITITKLECGKYVYFREQAPRLKLSPTPHLKLPLPHGVTELIGTRSKLPDDMDDNASVCTVDSGIASIASDSSSASTLASGRASPTDPNLSIIYIPEEAEVKVDETNIPYNIVRPSLVLRTALLKQAHSQDPKHWPMLSSTHSMTALPPTPIYKQQQKLIMASKYQSTPPGLRNSKGQRGTAKYKCQKCGEKWKMKQSRGETKTCENCGEKGILPYDFIPNPKRMFGDFNCSCGRHWTSGYAWIEWDEVKEDWVELKQECRGCKNDVVPTSLRPLRYTGSNASQKPHDSAACGMCQKYGDCRNLRSSEVEEGEWDDSVIDISDVTEDRNLSDGTPVNSDEESTDAFLSSYLKRLSLNNK